MKRYFLFALILSSGAVTSISALATCPMAAAQAGKSSQVTIAQNNELLPPEGGPAGVAAPAMAAPLAPPANMSVPKHPQ
jgi:hypothetical protein